MTPVSVIADETEASEQTTEATEATEIKETEKSKETEKCKVKAVGNYYTKGMTRTVTFKIKVK
jgi:hypothetical protein